MGRAVAARAELFGRSDQRVMVALNRHPGVKAGDANPELTKLRAIWNGLEVGVVPGETSCDMTVSGANPNGATAKPTVTEILENAATVVTNPPKTARSS